MEKQQYNQLSTVGSYIRRCNDTVLAGGLAGGRDERNGEFESKHYGAEGFATYADSSTSATLLVTRTTPKI
jgi:hypothetical protein